VVDVCPRPFEDVGRVVAHQVVQPPVVVPAARALLLELFRVWAALAAPHALPHDLSIPELRVGNGNQARRWLDEYVRMDRERNGGAYYRRLHYLMGDYSPHVLERARANVSSHAEHVSSLVLDARALTQTLRFLSYKAFLIYISNVYDNLPTDEIVRLGGHLFAAERQPGEDEGADRGDALARDELSQARHLPRSEGDVDEGELLEHPLPLALRPAPPNRDDRVRALARRIDRLPVSARRVLEAAAVLAHDCDAGMLARMTLLPMKDVVEGLARLLATELRTPTFERVRGAFAFAHDEVARATRAMLGPERLVAGVRVACPAR